MAIAKVKKYLKSMIITTAISITLLSGCTSSIPTPPSTTNNPPTISAPDSLSFDEGTSHSFNVDVSDEDSIDELTFSGESTEYSADFNTVDENTMEVVLTPKDNYRNFNGVSSLNLTVQDSQGAATQKDITLNVNDTPDVEFYNMPESVSLNSGESTEITGYIRDDYTSLEALVLNASCDNADVNIEKIGGDEFKIIIDANSDYSGDSEVVVNAADDEGNSNSYNLPISITMLENNPPTISAPDSLSFYEGISHSFNVDVSDEDDIDELTFSGESNEYSTGFNKVDENTMEVVLTPKDNYKNFNGVSNLNLTVQDSQGATAQKDITLNVSDTPDVEFYNMPDSVSLNPGETKEITGYIRDDYTPLEALVLNASCENADANIEKIGGEEFKIIIDANSDYSGDSEVVVNAADDEGNSSSYNLPISITMLENNSPTISAPDSLSFDEGISHSFSIDVSDEDSIDELTFSAESTEYSAGFNKVDENTMEVVLTPKDNYRNFNGVSNLNLTVQDSHGATAQKDITLNVNDTPDVEFYNMPESVSLNSGESTEITGHIRDDYTPLEALVLNASCENADVNIEKIGGDEFKIIIDANPDYSGDSEVVVNAADDEGNSSSYNLPITIIPLETRTLDVSLDFDGVNVTDNNDDDIIDEWHEVNDIGSVLISAYKVPVTSYDEYTVSTEFPELDSIYLEVDRNARECIMEEQEFSNSSDINFSLNYEDKTLEDFIIEIDVRDGDESHHNYSFLVDPQMEEVDKYIKIGQNDKILNILLGYGVANHENSREYSVHPYRSVAIPYSTGAWPDGSPEEIWWIVKEEDGLTPEASQAIIDSCEYFFPGASIKIIEEDFETALPDNIFLIKKGSGSAWMNFWNTDYENGTNYVRNGGVYLLYNSTGEVNEEIGTVAETAAEPPILGPLDSIFRGSRDVTPCDEAVFAIKHNQEPEVGWVVIYNPDPGREIPAIETKASWVANATTSTDGRTVYVLPKREEF